MSPEIQAGAQAEDRTEKEGLELNPRRDSQKLGEFLGKWNWKLIERNKLVEQFTTRYRWSQDGVGWGGGTWPQGGLPSSGILPIMPELSLTFPPWR